MGLMNAVGALHRRQWRRVSGWVRLHLSQSMIRTPVGVVLFSLSPEG